MRGAEGRYTPAASRLWETLALDPSLPSFLFGCGVSRDGKSKLHVFDAAGTEEPFSPVAVMGPGECVAGLAFYED